MEYYAALKRNKLSSHDKTWRYLNCILSNERSQSETVTYVRVIPTTWHSGKGKTMEITRPAVAGSERAERWTGGVQRNF